MPSAHWISTLSCSAMSERSRLGEAARALRRRLRSGPRPLASIVRKGRFDMAKVGFIGLGNMGIGLARNIAGAGWPLAVWNRSPGKAASLAGSNVVTADTPGAATKGAEFVVT